LAGSLNKAGVMPGVWATARGSDFFTVSTRPGPPPAVQPVPVGGVPFGFEREKVIPGCAESDDTAQAANVSKRSLFIELNLSAFIIA
jgi:hypothetical protein